MFGHLLSNVMLQNFNQCRNNIGQNYLLDEFQVYKLINMFQKIHQINLNHNIWQTWILIQFEKFADFLTSYFQSLN